MQRIRNASALAIFLLVVAAAVGLQLLATDGWVLHGGLFTDDWSIASIEHFDGLGGLWNALTGANSERQLAAVYQTVTASLAGSDPELHALWGFLTHLACVVSVLYLMRALGMEWLPAALLAVLVMVFPFSDSIWLWYAASHISLAIALGAGGALLALRGLESRPAWPWHLAAAAAFAASILTYQSIAVAVLLMLAIYLPRSSRRDAFLLLAKDVVAVVLAAMVPALLSGGRGADTAPAASSVGEAIDHAGEIADQASSLLGFVLIPFGSPNADVVVAAALCLFIAGTAVAAWGRGEAAVHARHWVGWGLAGAGLVVAGYAVFIPAAPAFYLPLIGGMGNRINALPGIGFSLIVVSLAMLAAGLPLLWSRWPRRLVPILAAALVLTVAIGYRDRTAADVADWRRAAESQTEQLAALESLGRPPPGTVDFVHGGTGQTAPGVFAFRTSYDLNSAVRLLWSDPTLTAYPVFEGTELTCGPTGVSPAADGPSIGPEHAGYYPGVFFTDVDRGDRTRIDSREECEGQLRRFVPGPVGG